MILFWSLNSDFHEILFSSSVNVNNQAVQSRCNGFTSDYTSLDQLWFRL